MVILIFWRWYYTEAVRNILKAWRNFIIFSLEYFSIPLLFKTLFAPWKRDITKKPRGLDIKMILQYLAYNTISRGLGFLVRFFTIIAGIVFFLLIIVLGAVFFVIWIFLPLIFLGLFILAILFLL